MALQARKAPAMSEGYTEIYNRARSLEEDLHAELYVTENMNIVIYHNKPMKRRLSWLEFDLSTNRLDFVMEDGEMKNFGIPVHPQLAKLMQNVHQIFMCLFDEKTETIIEGYSYPLVVHRDE